MRPIAITVVTAALLWLHSYSASAQMAKPKSPAAITEASQELAEKNNWCRKQAKDQQLTGKKRRAFIRDCKKQP